MKRLLAVATAVTLAAFSQIPPAEKLSPEDDKEFRAEIVRVEETIQTAGDKTTALYVLARTWAAGGQYLEAMKVLEPLVALKTGLDPSSERLFVKLKGSQEFQRLLEDVRADTPPVASAHPGFTINESDLAPEGIAYDTKSKRFFLGSTTKSKVIICDVKGHCQTLFDKAGLGEILGMKIDPRDGSLWAATNATSESALVHYQVPSGKLVRKYPVSGGRHILNDLVLDRNGNVFVTDTAAGTLYWLTLNGDRLEIFNPEFKVQATNGIAISNESHQKLYISDYPDGISVLDIASRSFHPMAHPDNLCLASIDGLYFFEGSLYAIQNGFMVHRVVRFKLNQKLDAISSFDVLERRNPIFDGPTTGAIAGHQFYFVANPHLDLPPERRVDRLQVLRIDLHH